MAVFKVISVPQKYADEDAYADLIHYCIRPMKTPLPGLKLPSG